MGAFWNATKVLIGTPSNRKGFFYNAIQMNKDEYADNPQKRNHFEYDYNVVCKYNKNYAKYIVGEKKRLGEKSDAFRMSYCLEWILSRGMFITSENFEKLKNPNLTFKHRSDNICVAGIDLGKSNDSTILSIGEPDFDHPTIIEKSPTNPSDTYEAYHTDLVALYDFGGEDWDSQFYLILEALSRYNIACVVIDATGVGSPIFDRLRANSNYTFIPYVYSTPSKSALYKHLDGEISGGRLEIPAEPDNVLVTEFMYDDLEKQFLDLQKFYRGQHLVVQHPDEQGAHDDYTDSIALMMWGAKEKPKTSLRMSKDSLFKSSKNTKQYYNIRNKYTSRRR
jgi:hypothetical protein